VISISNVPAFGQVLGGKTTEEGVKSGQPLVLGVPLPCVPLVEFLYCMFI
jgi:hypothetical protein